MTLEKTDLFVLRDVAMEAAVAAARIVASRAGETLAVCRKAAGDSEASQVVTEVDLLAQAAIIEVLAPATRAYDLGTLAEELSDDGARYDKSYFWCIDPLDGTLPYSEGRSGYAVSIGLVSRAGDPVLGIVCDPVENRCFDAVACGGCRMGGEPFRVADHSLVGDELTFFCDRSQLAQSGHAATLAFLQRYAERVGYSGVRCSTGGGAVMNACWTLLNPPACYFKYPKAALGGGSLWDFAATACLFAEAGGWASDIHGGRLELNRRESSFLNHRGVLFSSDGELSRWIRERSAGAF